MPAEVRAPGTVAYLDHAATTPMHPDALATMTRHLARSGTQGVAAIAGFASAVESAVRRQPGHAARVARLRDRSHVLLAMGADESCARGTLRVTLGHTTTHAEVDSLVEAIGPVVERALTRANDAAVLVRIHQRVSG